MGAECTSQPPSRRIHITGASGFVGKHLLATLQLPRWSHLTATGHRQRARLDDPAALAEQLGESRPDYVIHLAGQSHVPTAIADPVATLNTNLIGTQHLLSALDRIGFTGILLNISTAEVYGVVPESQLPVDETRLPAPRNPYAVAKLAAEHLVWQHTLRAPYGAINVRPFNHIGPGQSTRFAVPSFAAGLAAIAAGHAPPQLPVGNLQVTRDFTDVRDVVTAYLLLLERGHPGETYNLGTGRETLLADLLDQLIAISATHAVPVIDPARLRPAEQPRMCCNPHKLQQHTAWQPQFTLHQTLVDSYQQIQSES